MDVSQGEPMTTLERPAHKWRPSARLVVPAVVVVAVLAGVWVLGIVGWPPRVFDGDWQLRSAEVDGSALILTASRPLGLTLETGAGDNNAELQGPCNYLGGGVSGANDVIPDDSTDLGFTVGFSTAVLCAPAIARLEAAYVAAIGRIDHAERHGDVLTLTGPGVTLVFDRVAPGVLNS